MTMEMKCERLLDPSHWAYRGEGNANVVFSATVDAPEVLAYFGTPHVVLRVPKERAAVSAGGDHAAGTGPDPVAMSAFIQNVINPLFPEAHVPRVATLSVHCEFLEVLATRSKSKRPHARRKTKIDLCAPRVLLCPDYARIPGVHGPTLALELKPKWLFLPNTKASERRSAENLQQRQHQQSQRCIKPRRGAGANGAVTAAASTEHVGEPTACRFCMHQYLKTARDPAYRASAFCPLDLLEPLTVPNAVDALLSAPGNNLRMWIEGERMDLANADEPGETVPAAVPKVASNSGGGGENGSEDDGVGDPVVPSPSTALQHLLDMFSGELADAGIRPMLNMIFITMIPLLRILAQHQHALDGSDWDALRRDYDAVVAAQGQGKSITCDQWRSAVAQYLDRRAAEGKGSAATENITPARKDQHASLQTVVEHVLSMTLKDCSILIALAPTPESASSHTGLPPHVRTLEVAGTKCVYQAVLLDLDPKEMHKIPYWQELDESIRDHFSSVFK